MRTTVCFIDTTTNCTGTTGVARVNQDNGHPAQLRLVCDVLAQLVERPVSVLAPLSAANLCLTNTAQIFQSDCPLSVLRLLNKLLTDYVVGIRLETRLLARYFLEFSFGRLRALALKITAAVLIFSAVLFNTFSAEVFTIAVRCKVDDARINAENIFHILRNCCFNIPGCKEIKQTVNHTQVTLTPFTTQKCSLSVPACKRHALSAINRPQTDCGFIKLKRKNTAIVSNGTIGIKLTLFVSSSLISISHFRNATNCKLRTQRELLSDWLLDKVVKRKLAKGFVFPCLLTDVVTSSISRLNGLLEKFSLLNRGEKFYFRRQYHFHLNRYNLYCSTKVLFMKERSWASSAA